MITGGAKLSGYWKLVQTLEKGKQQQMKKEKKRKQTNDQKNKKTVMQNKLSHMWPTVATSVLE